MKSRTLLIFGLALLLGMGTLRTAYAMPLVEDNYGFLGPGSSHKTYDFHITSSGVYEATVVDDLWSVPFAALGIEIDFVPSAGGASLLATRSTPGSLTFEVLDSDLGNYEAIVTGTPGTGGLFDFPGFSTFGITVDRIAGVAPVADTAAPEPQTLFLAMLGLAAIGLQRRRARVGARPVA